jgi:hypothetical protein
MRASVDKASAYSVLSACVEGGDGKVARMSSPTGRCIDCSSPTFNNAARCAKCAANPHRPGFYPDPAGRFVWRYWDGRAWGASVRRGDNDFVDDPVQNLASLPRPVPGTDFASVEAKKAGSVVKSAIFAGMLLTVLALYGCAQLVGGGGPDRVEAFTVCQQFVEQRLKSPASADFPPPSEATISNSGDTWTIDGYVDAANSFGASLRSNFTCVVEHTGGDQWALVSLEGLT